MGYTRENLEELNMKQLKEVAKGMNFDVGGLKKTDLIDSILNYYNSEEATQMEEFRNEDGTVITEATEGGTITTEEFNGEATDVDTTAPATDEKEVFHLANGEECSKAAFIREQFTAFNKSRKEISEEFNIPYRTVYGACINLENSAESTGRGRRAGSSSLHANEKSELLTLVEVEGVVEVHINNELVEGAIAGEEAEDGSITVAFADNTSSVFMKYDRTAWVKEQILAGASRGDLAKLLDVSYGVIFGMTKDLSGTRTKHMVEVEEVDPESGEKKVVEISRNEYIRRLYADGMKKNEIAKELGVEYSTVWSATKEEKSDHEKFQTEIEKLAKFEDNMPEDMLVIFQDAIASLRAIVIPEKVEEAPAAEATPDEAIDVPVGGEGAEQ